MITSSSWMFLEVSSRDDLGKNSWSSCSIQRKPFLHASSIGTMVSPPLLARPFFFCLFFQTQQCSSRLHVCYLNIKSEVPHRYVVPYDIYGSFELGGLGQGPIRPLDWDGAKHTKVGGKGDVVVVRLCRGIDFGLSREPRTRSTGNTRKGPRFGFNASHKLQRILFLARTKSRS
jgi:hypothetical protein